MGEQALSRFIVRALRYAALAFFIVIVSICVGVVLMSAAYSQELSRNAVD